jgi:hypothetical protein
MGLINTLKYYGRSVVLPIDKIKSFSRQIVAENGITRLTDFGAGTLFWSKWFADELGLDVIAVDTAFASKPPKNHNPRITIREDIITVLREDKERNEKKALFICDVIHHLTPEFWESVLKDVVELYDVVIIKDIDATRKFGNFCNKMHDRIINGEKIHNVFQNTITNRLAQEGYAVKAFDVHKLWYPHFVLMGKK